MFNNTDTLITKDPANPIKDSTDIDLIDKADANLLKDSTNEEIDDTIDQVTSDPIDLD